MLALGEPSISRSTLENVLLRAVKGFPARTGCSTFWNPTGRDRARQAQLRVQHGEAADVRPRHVQRPVRAEREARGAAGCRRSDVGGGRVTQRAGWPGEVSEG